MDSIRSWAVYLIASLGMFSILYVAVALSIFAASLVMLQNGIAASIPILRKQQVFLYRGGIIRQWQGQRDCVEFDEQLLYKPRLGKCQFDNAEFRTTMHFSEEGRGSSAKPEGVGIAVLGDSHAMGWGVDDDETFAARLEKMIGRPVFNLGVSSYATYRELLALEKSKLLDRIDTIILQYCDNDASENSATAIAQPSYKPERLEELTSPARQGTYSVLSTWLKEAALSPAREVKRYFLPPPAWREDFLPHYLLIRKTLEQFPWVKEKRLIVFYTNSFGRTFSNYAEVIKAHDSGHIEFVEFNVGREYFFALDDHMTKAGHEKVAIGLAALLSKPPPRP